MSNSKAWRVLGRSVRNRIGMPAEREHSLDSAEASGELGSHRAQKTNRTDQRVHVVPTAQMEDPTRRTRRKPNADLGANETPGGWAQRRRHKGIPKSRMGAKVTVPDGGEGSTELHEFRNPGEEPEGIHIPVHRT